jgi:hypothetical protein
MIQKTVHEIFAKVLWSALWGQNWLSVIKYIIACRLRLSPGCPDESDSAFFPREGWR